MNKNNQKIKCYVDSCKHNDYSYNYEYTEHSLTHILEVVNKRHRIEIYIKIKHKNSEK